MRSGQPSGSVRPKASACIRRERGFTGKSTGPRESRNRPNLLPPAATDCLRRSMVRRGFPSESGRELPANRLVPGSSPRLFVRPLCVQWPAVNARTAADARNEQGGLGPTLLDFVPSLEVAVAWVLFVDSSRCARRNERSHDRHEVDIALVSYDVHVVAVVDEA